MTSELYKKHIENASDENLREMWQFTPWVINYFISPSDGYYQHGRIADWCRQHFGNMARPDLGKEGNWYSGLPIHGWMWIGFKTEKMMEDYLKRWSNLEN